jgi:anaerobic selenocysteine-containing dehydrogenase
MAKVDEALDVEVHYRTCGFCDQHCGTEVTIDKATRQVVGVRGDKSDPLSKGYVCPKVYALKDYHDDPDRLTSPMIKRNGRFEPVSWDEALDFTAERIKHIQREHGNDAIAFYFGTGLAHVPALCLYTPLLATTLGTKQVYSSSSVDCHAHFLTTTTMFGNLGAVPVPDVDHTDYILLIGANPAQSNGSFIIAPGMAARLRDIQKRGGKVVVMDPRRTETAKTADWHLSIRPGADAAVLFAMVNILFEEDLVELKHLGAYAANLDQLRELARPFSVEAASRVSGIAAEDIYKLTREFAAAPRACIYGRIGSSMQMFGSITNWLIVAVNALTGNLDREGGSMFPRGVVDSIFFSERCQDGVLPHGRWHSRATGLPELAGQLPCSALIPELETPGDGQIRALITMAGNPILATPNGGGRLTRALEKLDFMLSFDIYINEASRHADVILPSEKSLTRSDFTLFYTFFMVRDYMRYSPPIFEADENSRTDAQIISGLVGRLLGETTHAAEERALRMLHQQLIDQGNEVAARFSFDQVLQHLGTEGGQDRMLELLVRTGPYGDHLGDNPDGLTLEKLKAMPHGVDFGPMRSRIKDIVYLPDGKIDFAPSDITSDIPRLQRWMSDSQADSLLLVGRRQIRSFQWMHKFPTLNKGPIMCTLLMHPRDAAARGLADGQKVKVRSRTGEVVVEMELSEEMREGVVSLPHGWGHDDPEVPGQEIAKSRPGVNYNLLADETLMDVPSCNTNLNAIPVEVEFAA